MLQRMDRIHKGRLLVSHTCRPVGYRLTPMEVLLFDGTGNKFSGTDADSCILKILRLLDRNDASQRHYYQVEWIPDLLDIVAKSYDSQVGFLRNRDVIALTQPNSRNWHIRT